MRLFHSKRLIRQVNVPKIFFILISPLNYYKIIISHRIIKVNRTIKAKHKFGLITKKTHQILTKMMCFFLLDLFFTNKNSFNVRTQTALFVNVKNTTAKLSFSVRNFKLLRHTCNKFFYYCIILSAEYRSSEDLSFRGRLYFPYLSEE